MVRNENSWLEYIAKLQWSQDFIFSPVVAKNSTSLRFYVLGFSLSMSEDYY